MEAHPHPDSLFDGTTLALAYPDLLAVLARDHPAAVAAAARALEAGAASLRRLNPGSTFTSPGAFLARGWIARTDPTDVEGVHESQARDAAGRHLNGRVTELRQRSQDGLVFGYEPANQVTGVAPPLVRVRPVEGGRRHAVDLLDPEDGSASHVATPAPAPVRWDGRGAPPPRELTRGSPGHPLPVGGGSPGAGTPLRRPARPGRSPSLPAAAARGGTPTQTSAARPAPLPCRPPAHRTGACPAGARPLPDGPPAGRRESRLRPVAPRPPPHAGTAPGGQPAPADRGRKLSPPRDRRRLSPIPGRVW